MGDLAVQRLVAAGASQSAAYLRTYINGVHPFENVFDGFIPYLDFGSTAALQPDRTAYLSAERRRESRTARVREDLSVPVLVVNSETETQPYLRARQPDSDRFRFWEVAGSSHVTVSRTRATARKGLESANCLTFAPVYEAAIRHMHVWLTDGTLPPMMPRIATTTDEAGRQTIKRDELGNAVGGIRLPDFAVATAEHRGLGAFGAGNRLGFLYGYARDFTDDELAALYPSRSAFLVKYDAALSDIVESGAVLPEDAPLVRKRAAEWAMRLPLSHE